MRQNQTRSPSANRKTHQRAASPPRRGMSARARRRSRMLLIFYIFVVLIIIATAVLLSLTVLFKINIIEVTGTSCYSSEQIIKVSGIKKGENLFLADTKLAQTKILNQLPYVGKATIKRRLPAKVQISVSPASISGAVKENSKYVIVDSESKVLEITNKLPPKCPEILGLNLKDPIPGKKINFANSKVSDAFNKLAVSMRKGGLKKITQIDIRNIYAMKVRYDNRITINFGTPNDLDFKVNAAQKIVQNDKNNGLSLKDKGVLDVSLTRDLKRAYFEPTPSEHTSSDAKKSTNESSSKKS